MVFSRILLKRSQYKDFSCSFGDVILVEFLSRFITPIRLAATRSEYNSATRKRHDNDEYMLTRIYGGCTSPILYSSNTFRLEFQTGWPFRGSLATLARKNVAVRT